MVQLGRAKGSTADWIGGNALEAKRLPSKQKPATHISNRLGISAERAPSPRNSNRIDRKTEWRHFRCLIIYLKIIRIRRVQQHTFIPISFPVVDRKCHHIECETGMCHVCVCVWRLLMSSYQPVCQRRLGGENSNRTSLSSHSAKCH